MHPGMDYDEAADVLYINFQRPSGPGRDTATRSSLLGHASPADHSELDDDDTIRRYQGDRMVGFTILNASQRE
jgi:uncharacterized protein YuzE